MKHLLIICISFFCLLGCGNSDPADNFATSYTVAKYFIKEQLNYPSEATFERKGLKHEYLGNKTCKFEGVVKAKNAFGVASLHKYRITLKYVGGNDRDIRNWKATQFSID